MIEMVCIVACGVLLYILSDPAIWKNGTIPPAPLNPLLSPDVIPINNELVYLIIGSGSEGNRKRTKKGRRIERGKSGNH